MEDTLLEQEDEDDVALGELSRAMHTVFKTHTTQFLADFHKELFPTISGMLFTPKLPTSAQASNDRSLAN